MDQDATSPAEEKRPVFVSLGMFILDELRFSNSKTVSNVPGGSGLYATFGARLFKPPPQSKDVGCIILGGNDIPDSTVALLKSWDMNLQLHRDPEQKCTRGLLQYEDDAFSRNTFDYTTPPLRPTPSHLTNTPLLHAQSFHLLALPSDLETIVPDLLSLRSSSPSPLNNNTRPLIVWEPAPKGCTHTLLAAHLSACRLIDIFSPNRSELCSLLNVPTTTPFTRTDIESLGSKFIESGIGPAGSGYAIIRCGEHGVCILSRNQAPIWIPTFYETSERVVDATGAGNAFLGALAVGMVETNDIEEACLRGSVAASYALEQFGPPVLGSRGDGEEWWNEYDVVWRLGMLKARTSDMTEFDDILKPAVRRGVE